MTWQLLFAIAAGCLVGADAPDDPTRRDIARWQGVWHAVSLDDNGAASPAEKLQKITLTVSGTEYHFQNGSFSEHGTYTFRGAKQPKELDITVGDGTDKGKIYLVIYQFAGDELTLCFEKANQRRPREFSGKAGSGCVLEVWRRATP